MNVHKNARLTPSGRALLAQRVSQGWTAKAAAEAAGVCLFAKRLEDGEFRWPKIQDGVMRLAAGGALDVRAIGLCQPLADLSAGWRQLMQLLAERGVMLERLEAQPCAAPGAPTKAPRTAVPGPHAGSAPAGLPGLSVPGRRAVHGHRRGANAPRSRHLDRLSERPCESDKSTILLRRYGPRILLGNRSLAGLPWPHVAQIKRALVLMHRGRPPLIEARVLDFAKPRAAFEMSQSPVRHLHCYDAGATTRTSTAAGPLLARSLLDGRDPALPHINHGAR